jgi:signal transduction histidine kinase
MTQDRANTVEQHLKQAIRGLLKVRPVRFALALVVVAVVVSVMIVMSIDLLWDGRLNAELEFAGVVTPFLDGIFIAVFMTAMLNELREELSRRDAAEEGIRLLNDQLEMKIQELHQAQDKLVRKEKLAVLGLVAGSVGHELRNPLAVMSNAVYFLQLRLDDADDTTREYLGILQEEIAEADRIVSGLLDSVRTKPPQPENVALAELVGQELDKYALPASVAVKVQIAAALAPVYVDRQQIRQVLHNLVRNAVDAMAAGGSLEIRACEGEGDVAITVGDTGVGMTAQQLASLFQPLVTSKARGIGLGLVVVKNLTEANGGRIDVASQAGKGTTFTLTLPSVRAA